MKKLTIVLAIAAMSVVLLNCSKKCVQTGTCPATAAAITAATDETTCTAAQTAVTAAIALHLDSADCKAEWK